MITALLSFFGDLGLPGIFFLMAVESSIFPLPSEVVMIPAGVLAAGGHYSAWVAILVGGLGSLAGAWVNYSIGMFLGRPFILKYGKYFLMREEKYIEAEELFLKNSTWYTFFGRLLPVIRHLISLPAGVFRMNGVVFSAVTFIGATLWCSVLVGLGYFFGESVLGLFEHYLFEVKVVVVIGLLLFAVWFLRKKR